MIDVLRNIFEAVRTSWGWISSLFGFVLMAQGHEERKGSLEEKSRNATERDQQYISRPDRGVETQKRYTRGETHLYSEAKKEQLRKQYLREKNRNNRLKRDLFESIKSDVNKSQIDILLTEDKHVQFKNLKGKVVERVGNKFEVIIVEGDGNEYIDDTIYSHVHDLIVVCMEGHCEVNVEEGFLRRLDAGDSVLIPSLLEYKLFPSKQFKGILVWMPPITEEIKEKAYGQV